MFSKSGFLLSCIRAILLTIFIFHTCQVHSQDDTTDFTISTNENTNAPQELNSSPPVLIVTPDGTAGPDASTNKPPTVVVPTNNPEGATTPDGQVITTDSKETAIIGTTTSTTTPTPTTTTTTTIDSNQCPVGQFPFANGCIGASENGGVVITAFILSLISIIGALGLGGYLLFSRLISSPKKTRMLTNNATNGKPMLKGSSSQQTANNGGQRQKKIDDISMEPLKKQTQRQTATVVDETKKRIIKDENKQSAPSSEKARQDQKPKSRPPRPPAVNTTKTQF